MLYEVGGCAEKTCRGTSSENGLCGPSKTFCCLPSSQEERTVQCDDYTLQVLVTTGCSCGQCSSGDITIQGQVNGLNTGIALRIGTVYVNGSSVGRTTYTGLFSFTVPKGTRSVAITLEDTIFNTLLTITKLITLDESTQGRLYQKIALMEAAPPITISSDVENTISMGNNSDMPAVVEVVIPPDSFIDSSGNRYTGIVKASVNLFDPRDIRSISVAPGSFEFTDEEGMVQNLQTFGVIVMDLIDESGNKLNVAGNVTIKVDAGLVETENPADVKLWGLNDVTGLWEEVGAMVMDRATRKKRELRNFIVGSVSISAFTAINIDYKFGYYGCCFASSVVDRNGNMLEYFRLRIIYMKYPGALYPNTSTEYVTAVEEVWFRNNYPRIMWCRNDSWGYIQAYNRYGDFYTPGELDSSGLSPTARSSLEYETINDPIGIKSKFVASSNGPFFDNWSTCYMQKENKFKFYENTTLTVGHTYIERIDPLVAWGVAITTGNDLGPKLWYPYTNTHEMKNYRICMMKIVVDGPTDGLNFSVKSIAGPNSGIENMILGVREVTVENGAACVEYKCSGEFPSFQNMIDDSTQTSPIILRDDTKVTITPKGRFCTVAWESDIKSHSSNSDNIGNVNLEWLIPDKEDEGIYIYEQTYFYPEVDWESFLLSTTNMCKEGKTDPSSENPIMNTDNPAVKFTCI